MPVWAKFAKLSSPANFYLQNSLQNISWKAICQRKQQRLLKSDSAVFLYFFKYFQSIQKKKKKCCIWCKDCFLAQCLISNAYVWESFSIIFLHYYQIYTRNPRPSNLFFFLAWGKNKGYSCFAGDQNWCDSQIFAMYVCPLPLKWYLKTCNMCNYCIFFHFSTFYVAFIWLVLLVRTSIHPFWAPWLMTYLYKVLVCIDDYYTLNQVSVDYHFCTTKFTVSKKKLY